MGELGLQLRLLVKRLGSLVAEIGHGCGDELGAQALKGLAGSVVFDHSRVPDAVALTHHGALGAQIVELALGSG